MAKLSPLTGILYRLSLALNLANAPPDVKVSDPEHQLLPAAQRLTLGPTVDDRLGRSAEHLAGFPHPVGLIWKWSGLRTLKS